MLATTRQIITLLATTRQIITLLATTRRIIAVLARLALVLLGSIAYVLVAGVAPASAHQPHDPMFTVAVSPNYANDHTVFAVVPTGTAAERGLYRSSDGGTTWSLLPASQGFTIVSLAVSPNYTVDHTVFVGTLERSLLVSTDGGNTYAGTGFTDAYVTAVAVSPAYASDRTLYAAAYQGIWESKDGAATWRPMPIKATFSTLESSVIRSGNWYKLTGPGADCTDVYGSSTMSDTIQFAFSGTGITWTSGKGVGYGTANVYLDGVFQQTVDLYAPSYASQQTLYQNQALAPGSHSLQIVVTGQHDPQALGSLVTVDDLIVTRTFQ